MYATCVVASLVFSSFSLLIHWGFYLCAILILCSIGRKSTQLVQLL